MGRKTELLEKAARAEQDAKLTPLPPPSTELVLRIEITDLEEYETKTGRPCVQVELTVVGTSHALWDIVPHDYAHAMTARNLNPSDLQIGKRLWVKVRWAKSFGTGGWSVRRYGRTRKLLEAT